MLRAFDRAGRLERLRSWRYARAGGRANLMSYQSSISHLELADEIEAEVKKLDLCIHHR